MIIKLNNDYIKILEYISENGSNCFVKFYRNLNPIIEKYSIEKVLLLALYKNINIINLISNNEEVLSFLKNDNIDIRVLLNKKFQKLIYLIGDNKILLNTLLKSKNKIKIIKK